MSHLFSATRMVNSPLITVSLSPRCVSTPPTRVRRPRHRIHLGQLAFSGAGLLILEATAVEPAGRISPGIWGCGMMKPKRPARRSRRYSGRSPIRLGIQLGHAGRKASCAARGREAISWRSTMVAGRPSPLPPWRFTMAIAPR